MRTSFLRRPRQHWLRRALFQVHLWTGVAVGVYLFVIGLTGAILVFRPELQARQYPEFFDRADGAGPLADPAAVIADIQRTYPGSRFSGIDYPTYRRNTFLAYVARGSELKTVFSDRVTGRVLGELPTDSWLHWLQELHFNLLSGSKGIVWNGIGAACLMAMCLSGLIIWWQGAATWTRALIVGTGKGWKRVNWELHGALGFWMAALLLVWAVSGFYFSFPLEVRSAVNAVSPLSATTPPRSNPALKDAALPPAPGVLLARAQAALPGAQVARYALSGSETAVIQVVLATKVHGDYDSSDEVTLYFDQYSGTLLGRGDNARRSAGDLLFAWMFPLHAGTFGGLAIKIAWVLLGLSLPLLFTTGVIMWWNRVVVRWYDAAKARAVIPLTDDPSGRSRETRFRS
jgi:uncharacterized iron-regulated membrane protein